MATPTPTIVKVGLDPKKQTQTRKSYDPRTRITTVTILEYWRVVWSGAQSDSTQNLKVVDPAGNTLPDTGDSYQNKGQIFCVDVMPMLDPTSAGKQYLVQVTYQNLVLGSGTQQPAKWDCSVEFDGERFTETVYFDLNNKAILNSALQPFVQQPTQTYYITTIPLTFKTTQFDETQAEPLRGMMNQEPITISIAALNYKRTFPAQTLLLDNFRAKPVTTTLQGTLQTLAYWDVALDFKFAPLITSPVDGSEASFWKTFLLDQGYATKDTASGFSGYPKQILDSQNLPLAMPMYLDGNGNKSTTAHYLEFDNVLPKDFSVLIAGIA